MRLGTRRRTPLWRLARRIGYGAAGLLGLVMLLLAWGVIEPRLILDTEEEVARIPELPDSWEGQRVGLIADFQVGMWLANTGMVGRAVSELVEERPALVLVAGDFIYKPGEDPSGEIDGALELLRPLPKAGIPTYAVLGNHDYAINWRHEPKRAEVANELTSALEAIGVRVLQNEVVPVPPPSATGGEGSPLYLVGIGSAWAEEDRPEVVNRVPEGAPRLVVMHNPDSFAGLPEGTAPLAVAAHTHGGQVRLPFTPEWTWMTYTREDEVHADGWIDGYGEPGNRLYVNRGIGFSLVPMRLNCPPELTLFTLSAAGNRTAR